MNQFEDYIKRWVTTDNKLRTLNDEVKQIREKRNEISLNVMNHVENNNLNNATIKISDGILKFASVKQTSPLTLKFIEQCLSEYLDDSEEVDDIMKFIKNKRDIKYVFDIKRNYN
tara:strand:- start:159 stop:503 length:345 start_codon:yes stop_codon:yes gene_type:complete